MVLKDKQKGHYNLINVIICVCTRKMEMNTVKQFSSLEGNVTHIPLYLTV